LAVRLGDRATRWFYVALVVGAAVAAVVCAFDRPFAALGALALGLAVAPIRTVLGGATGRNLIPVLGGTGVVQLAYGLLLTVGLVIG
jgi:1,4-dihydroxy-2-naphthoate polyprenyltransferase